MTSLYRRLIVGDKVVVCPRTKPGENYLGGLGIITAAERSSNDGVVYEVFYPAEGASEHAVLPKYISGRWETNLNRSRAAPTRF